MTVELLRKIIGAACWHISAGGVTAPSFILVMGDKIPRAAPLRNPSQPDDFKSFRGSIELLVWSSWRLQTKVDVLATSDQGEAGLPQLDSLVGVPVVDVVYYQPAWDLRIRFADGRELVTFSDHLGPQASIAENWEFWAAGKHLVAGPGTKLVDD
jgi:hypothetical protein